MSRTRPLGRLFTLLGAVLVLAALAAPAAQATVSVSRAEVSGGGLRLEGRALASRTITVDGVAMGTSDGGGAFRIERSPYAAPLDCTVDVDDGSAAPASARLSGCTVSSTPAPAPATLSSLALSPASVTGGGTSTGTVTLTSAAPAGGLTVTLSSSSTSASVPPSVVVAGGAGRATFTVTTTAVTVTTSATITATGGGVQRSSALTVERPTSTLAIDDRPLGDANVGTDYNSFVTGQGGTGPYTWSIAAGALPNGLSLRDFAPGSGHIFGRPTTVQTSTFTVRVTDQAGASATRQFTITVNPPRPLIVNHQSDQLSNGTVGEPYAIGVFADGGTTPYTWTRTAGQLPPGLALQASPGRIQGTPTTSGTFSFTLRVDDAAGQSATRTFSITIGNPAPPPSPPPTPSLVSPENGASVTTPFTIGWTAVEDPEGIIAYNWAVSRTADFADPSEVGTAPGTATSASVQSNLPAGTYFWRVQAVDGRPTQGAWSAARTVNVTGTTNPPALLGVSVDPADVPGGTSATGAVTITLPAPAEGVTIALSNGAPDAATIPASVTVPAGQTRATFTVTTQPMTANRSVVITATLGGESRFAFLNVSPTAAPAPADTVAIQRATYETSRRTLAVEATSTNASATLRVFRTSTGVQIGTLANQGGGRYRSTFTNVTTNPGTITVRSSAGGSATRTVTVR